MAIFELETEIVRYSPVFKRDGMYEKQERKEGWCKVPLIKAIKIVVSDVVYAEINFYWGEYFVKIYQINLSFNIKAELNEYIKVFIVNENDTKSIPENTQKKSNSDGSDNFIFGLALGALFF